ncbi:unnamed protein product [Symbiodinium sp. KB8]|nr:unnamed protein product [Symbiodinium sp. KB8]
MVEQDRFNADGLAAEWEAEAVIRERVRTGHNFVAAVNDQNLDACNKLAIRNCDVMTPVLVRMTACSLKLPDIDPLRGAVRALYLMASREISDSHIDDEAWAIRHLAGFIKRKTQKKLVSLDPDFQDMCLVLNPELEDYVQGIRDRAAEAATPMATGASGDAPSEADLLDLSQSWSACDAKCRGSPDKQSWSLDAECCGSPYKQSWTLDAECCGSTRQSWSTFDAKCCGSSPDKRSWSACDAKCCGSLKQSWSAIDAKCCGSPYKQSWSAFDAKCCGSPYKQSWSAFDAECCGSLFKQSWSAFDAKCCGSSPDKQSWSACDAECCGSCLDKQSWSACDAECCGSPYKQSWSAFDAKCCGSFPYKQSWSALYAKCCGSCPAKQSCSALGAKCCGASFPANYSCQSGSTCRVVRQPAWVGCPRKLQLEMMKRQLLELLVSIVHTVIVLFDPAQEETVRQVVRDQILVTPTRTGMDEADTQPFDIMTATPDFVKQARTPTRVPSTDDVELKRFKYQHPGELPIPTPASAAKVPTAEPASKLVPPATEVFGRRDQLGLRQALKGKEPDQGLEDCLQSQTGQDVDAEQNGDDGAGNAVVSDESAPKQKTNLKRKKTFKGKRARGLKKLKSLKASRCKDDNAPPHDGAALEEGEDDDELDTANAEPTTRIKAKGKTTPKAKAKPKARGKAKAAPKSKSAASAITPKPKAKAKAKAAATASTKDASTKPKPKGKAKAKAAPKADPSAKPGKGKRGRKALPDGEVDQGDVDYMVSYFQHFDDLSDRETLKQQVQDHMPPFEYVRLDIYWSRYGCGLSLYCDGTRKAASKRNVGYFSFGNCDAGLLVAIACAICLGWFIEEHKITDPELPAISEKEFIALVLMILWTKGLFNLVEVFEWVEFFAGAKLDKKYFEQSARGTNYYDINTSAGFAPLGSKIDKCSCLMLLAVALGGCFVLEQPGSSVLEFYPAFRHVMSSLVLVSGVDSVCRVGWWMGHYNARIYPLQFAEAVADIFEDLKSTCKGCPSLPSQVPAGLELYASATTPEDVRLMYETANFGDVYDYLRGCKYLHIPEDWTDYRIIEEGKFCFCNGVEVGHLRLWAFEKEEAEERMFPLPFTELRNRYSGSALRVVAQAVNNEFVMNDRLESPGAREVSAIQKLGGLF